MLLFTLCQVTDKFYCRRQYEMNLTKSGKSPASIANIHFDLINYEVVSWGENAATAD